ncbi:MAG: DUF2491 family protein [Gammaproteobacteria bacterium]|nr:MAG: DUF2491 family protein [Gammaproteobacteria bacterium]
MSWKNAVNYTKNIWAKDIAQKHGFSNGDQDKDLPLGARIGGFIRMQKSPFIRAISEGSLIDMPTDAQSVIKAISRVKLNLSGSLYRYYLQTGDVNEKEIFLQVYVNPQGQVEEAIYCTQLTRLIPETDEDQQIFMGLAGYGLGDKNYSLWRFQLEELGFVESDLQVIFGVDDTIDYARDAGDTEQEFLEPFTGSEIRLDDALGQSGLQQKIYFMPYKRKVKENAEYLFITTELLESKNGDASQREIHVDFMVGIPVELERVVIQ